MSNFFKPLAYISAAAVSLLGLVSTRSRKARYYLNLTLYLSTLGLCSVLGVVYSLTLSLVGQRLNINYLTARSFYYLCYPLIGMKLEVEGREHLEQLLLQGENGKAQSAVLVGNHQSFIDILYLGRIFPHRAVIMAKKELRWAPLLGQYLTLSGAVMVDRKNSKDAVKMMHHVGEDMKRKGVALWIFPEGTRSSSAENTLLPFKKGAFHLAVQAAVPIVPVVCENYHRLFDGKSRFNRGVLKIKILPPVSTQGLTTDDVGKLADDVRESMLSTLREISAPGPSQLTEVSDDESESAPLTGRQTDYGSGTTSTEIRRRTSASSTAKDVAEIGSLEGGVTAGVVEAVKAEGSKGSKEEGTEDELTDEGAVLVKRP